MVTKILCRASDCIFNETRWCSTEEITYDPVEGCLTYTLVNQANLAEAEEVLLEEELAEELEWDDEELLFEAESTGEEWKDEYSLADELEEDLEEENHYW